MALGTVGSGQAGFGSGGAGTSKGLNYLGDFASATSGLVDTASDSFVSHLDFTTGSSFLVGTVSFMGPTKESDTADGANALFQVTLNGETIILAKLSTLTGDDVGAPSMVTPILIPPYSRITAGAKSGAGSQTTVINIQGRVYA
jgi:hypothetical protein